MQLAYSIRLVRQQPFLLNLLSRLADTTGMSVKPSQLDLVARLLDVTSMRHRVIAQNVANVNTPGYRRLEVSFEQALARQLEAGFDEIPDLKAKVVEASGGIERHDGNNVDVDAEMGRLQKNTLLFSVYSQVLALKMSAMRSAISGR
jgi:flagellar basal-body rod protein FlgB